MKRKIIQIAVTETINSEDTERTTVYALADDETIWMKWWDKGDWTAWKPVSDEKLPQPKSKVVPNRKPNPDFSVDKLGC